MIGPGPAWHSPRPSVGASVGFEYLMPCAPVVLLRAAGTSLRGTAQACGIALSTVQGILAEQVSSVAGAARRGGVS
ncbi:hypothetical protein ACFQS7_30745 [Dankookia sp. GCM10030260]|uniref:hypothetical protein n=1 Tax=Dankookia sp. GCM10030260 TaxID=3273390 RepID=UPI003620A166